MFCKKCGGKISDDAKFCGKCGQKVLEEKIETITPQTTSETQQDLKKIEQIKQDSNYKNNEEKFGAIVNPIIADFKSGNSDRALKVINEYIYNDNTNPELKNNLKQIKEVMEERLIKNGAPVAKAPSLYTLNGVGTKIYGDTLYFVVFFIPIFPVARYKLERQGRSFRFQGKLKLHTWQKAWIFIGIVVIIWLIFSATKA